MKNSLINDYIIWLHFRTVKIFNGHESICNQILNPQAQIQQDIHYITLLLNSRGIKFLDAVIIIGNVILQENCFFNSYNNNLKFSVELE